MPDRFIRRGKAKIKWVPTIAAASNADGSPGNPTRAEITAGVDLTPELADMAGFDINNSPVPTPDAIDTFTPSIGGEDTPGAPTLTFYESLGNTDTYWTTLPKGAQGFLYYAPKGDATGKATEIWRVDVVGRNRQSNLVANEPARFIVGFSPTSRPNQSGVAPATV